MYSCSGFVFGYLWVRYFVTAVNVTKIATFWPYKQCYKSKGFVCNTNLIYAVVVYSPLGIIWCCLPHSFQSWNVPSVLSDISFTKHVQWCVLCSDEEIQLVYCCHPSSNRQPIFTGKTNHLSHKCTCNCTHLCIEKQFFTLNVDSLHQPTLLHNVHAFIIMSLYLEILLNRVLFFTTLTKCDDVHVNF